MFFKNKKIKLIAYSISLSVFLSTGLCYAHESKEVVDPELVKNINDLAFDINAGPVRQRVTLDELAEKGYLITQKGKLISPEYYESIVSAIPLTQKLQEEKNKKGE